LAGLDQIGLKRYHITEKDVRTVEKYLSIIQAGLQVEGTYAELVQYSGYYGTSILIHEVIEIRELEARGVKPLQQKPGVLRRLLAQNVYAHVLGVYEEHRYLQEVINRLFGLSFEVATLIRANRTNDTDFQMFLESDVGIYLLEEARVDEARGVIARLKGVVA
jgi:hypothetical protein